MATVSQPTTRRFPPLQAAETDPERRQAEDERLLRLYARTRDPDALEALVERFLPLAKSLASRYSGGREPHEDLVQIASYGLVNSITRFDPDRGFAFASFAVPTILGELRRNFRDRGWSMRVPRDLQERSVKVDQALSELPARLGRSPSIRDIAEHLLLTDEEVLEAMEAGGAHHAGSIDTQANGDDEPGQAIIDRLGEEEPGYDAVEYGASIAPALARLPERDRRILHLRFVEDRTQSEIATEIGVSQMHVSRILRSTLKKLRAMVPEDEAA